MSPMEQMLIVILVVAILIAIVNQWDKKMKAKHHVRK